MSAEGFLTDIQVLEAIEAKDIIIYPFDKQNLTPVGYNFSFSRFIVSLNKRNFVPIIRDEVAKNCFFVLKPNETVLVLTYETIAVSKYIGGTFHSKVSLVAAGLGHVSTTLDPGWQGQLLIPLNNPTKHSVKVVIEETKNEKNIRKTFLTLVMFSSTQSAVRNAMENKPARIEILEKIISGENRNRKRKELCRAVRVISGFYNKEMLINLDTRKLRRMNYDQYIKQQSQFLRELNAKYPDISRAAQELRVSNKLKFVSIIMANVIGLVALSVSGCLITNTVIANIIKVLVPVFIPFSIFSLYQIKDRYI